MTTTVEQQSAAIGNGTTPEDIDLSSVITLDDVNGGDKPLRVQFGTKFLNVVYNQAKYTPLLEREMHELAKENLAGNMLATMLSRILISWDLVQVKESKGKKFLAPVPLEWSTLDTLLSIKGMSIIVDALAEDQRPNETKSENFEQPY